MNRIVRDNYPASNLPEDLRDGLAPGEEVRITIEPTSNLLRGLDGGAEFQQLIIRPEHILSLEDMLAMRRPVFSSTEEIDAHIRALRDEWD
jgi:hypothetical protein